MKVEMPSEYLSYSGVYGSVGTTINIGIKNGEIDLPALSGERYHHKNMYTRAMDNLKTRMEM